MSSKRLLFTGYAPVHFLCFRPIYEELRRVPGLTVHLSGEIKYKRGNGDCSTAADRYRPFPVAKADVVPLEEALESEYDMLLCAHVRGYFPRRDRERVQIFHGVSFRNAAIRREVLIYDHLFITGPYMCEPSSNDDCSARTTRARWQSGFRSSTRS